jgi:tRNA A-37 threonylcarbamoyl transferase component Bud32/tetratricopeptide (TPR) repeat protein
MQVVLVALDQAQSPSRRLAPGTTFDGRYWVISHVGEGGMAHVYKARHLHLDQIVALKLLRKDSCNDPVKVKRFQVEAKAASSLSHPKLLNVQGFGICEGTPYLVMEYVEGDSLDAVLDAHGPMPIARVIEIGRQVSAALGFLHEHRIVHRDIKPANIVSTAGGACKVVDFGIAKIYDDAGAALSDDQEETTASGTDSSQSLTRTGALIGTPAYMSPEQAMGAHLDGRSDIYSLGCLLFELATGRPPYVADTPYNVLALHLKGTIPFLTDFLPDTQSDTVDAFDAIIRQCLAKSPDDRFQSMEELGTALSACRQDAETNEDGGAAMPASGAVKGLTRVWRRLNTAARRAFKTPADKQSAARRSRINTALLVVAVMVAGSIPVIHSMPVKKPAADDLELASPRELMRRGIEEAVANNNEKSALLLKLALSKLKNAGQFERAEVEFQLGGALRNLLRFEEAIPYFEAAQRALEKQGSDRAKDAAIAHFHSAYCYYRIGQWQKAIPGFEHAVRLGVGGDDVLFPLADCYLQQNRLTESCGVAHPWDDQRSAASRDIPRYHEQEWGALPVLLLSTQRSKYWDKIWIDDDLAATYMKLGYFDEAKDWAEKIRTDDPTLAWLNEERLGRIFLAQGDLGRARRFMTEARARVNAGTDPYGLAREEADLGVISFRERKYAEAQQHFETAHDVLVKSLGKCKVGSKNRMELDTLLWVQRGRDLSRHRAAAASQQSNVAPPQSGAAKE